MNNAKIKFNLYEWATYFLACSFMGWLLETSKYFVAKHRFVPRGIIFTAQDIAKVLSIPQNILPKYFGLPLIPLYGIAGLIICVFFIKLKSRPVTAFFTGLISFTALEYTSAVICEKSFHKKFWDYSGKFLNLNGNICFSSALAWGASTLIVLYLLRPLLFKLYTRFRYKRYYRFMCGFLLLAAIGLLLFQVVLNLK